MKKMIITLVIAMAVYTPFHFTLTQNPILENEIQMLMAGDEDIELLPV